MHVVITEVAGPCFHRCERLDVGRCEVVRLADLFTGRAAHRGEALTS